MRPKDRALADQLETTLLLFDRKQQSLPGIHNSEVRKVFLEQMLESIHRVRYVVLLRERSLSDSRADPSNDLFDPLMAAVIHHCKGDIEEAYWLTFLAVHFGKNARAGWRYAREVYSSLGEKSRWSWKRTSADPAAFRRWLGKHQNALKRGSGPRGFSNHRKYESLNADSATGTGAAIETYVRWIGPPRTHQQLMEQAILQASGNPRRAFDALYQSMRVVARFGRTARFDYLTMVGKLGLASIEPGSCYLNGSTGPLRGARLLFGGSETASLRVSSLDQWLVELEAKLNVGMQVLEDALCNWQKSPGTFRPFRG